MSVMKRFWDNASVTAGEGGFAVLLDQKPMRIPGGTKLLIPGRALADAIAAEWQAAGGGKGGSLTFEDVPLTRLAGTAQDRIAPNPAPVAQELARYAETDLLCYRADKPEALVIRQARAWQPWLDWLERTHGARLEPAEGVMYHPQDPAALARVRAVMESFGPPRWPAWALPSRHSAARCSAWRWPPGRWMRQRRTRWRRSMSCSRRSSGARTPRRCTAATAWPPIFAWPSASCA